MKKIFKLLSLFCLFTLALLMVSKVALAQATCTVNGQEIPCEEFGQQLQGFWWIPVVFFVIGIASLVFWIMMLVHAATHQIENQAVWIIIIVLTGVIGALIYYFVVKRNFNLTAPTTPQTPIS